jgi:hypothetical protein
MPADTKIIKNNENRCRYITGSEQAYNRCAGV